MSFLKPLILVSAFSISLTSSVYLGIDKGEIIVFNFYGSSSMRDFMERLLIEYSKSEKSKQLSFNIASIGSSSGLEKVLNGSNGFALVSYDASKLHSEDAYKSKWNSQKLKTILLAKEPIVLLYKPPVNCSKDLIISKSNVDKIYSLFSGHKKSSVQNPITFKNLLENHDESDCDSEVNVWVKGTGPSKSGTAKAFVDNPLLSSNTSSDWHTKIKQSYGEDYILNYAPESTMLHWDSFKNNLRDGSMTYLPGNFVFQNWDAIQSYGIKFAKYKKEDGEESAQELKKDQTNPTNYEWIRSYSIVYSVSDISGNENKKKFLEYLVQNLSLLSNLKLNPYSYKLKTESTSSSSASIEIDVTKSDQDSASSKPKSK